MDRPGSSNEKQEKNFRSNCEELIQRDKRSQSALPKLRCESERRDEGEAEAKVGLIKRKFNIIKKWSVRSKRSRSMCQSEIRKFDRLERVKSITEEPRCEEKVKPLCFSLWISKECLKINSEKRVPLSLVKPY